MGEVVHLPLGQEAEVRTRRFSAWPCELDGAKERNRERIDTIKRRDNFKFRNFAEPIFDNRDDLMMDHADPGDNGMPSDSAYSAPDWDPA